MIVRKFRKAVSYESGDNTHHPSMKNPHSFQQSKMKKVGSRWPTFSEFVDFLLFETQHNGELDMHWTPVVQFCTPCLVKFDVILKFETLDEDQRYLIEKASLNGVIKPEHKNSGKGKNTQELLMSYYAQLKKSQVKGLYEIFKFDFEVFDYNPNEYFNAAKSDETVVEVNSEGIEHVELNFDRSKLLPFS